MLNRCITESTSLKLPLMNSSLVSLSPPLIFLSFSFQRLYTRVIWMCLRHKFLLLMPFQGHFPPCPLKANKLRLYYLCTAKPFFILSKYVLLNLTFEFLFATLLLFFSPALKYMTGKSPFHRQLLSESSHVH